MEKYFYIKNDTQYGPFTVEQLRSKKIDRETMVWKNGMDEWLPAGEVPEIAELLPPPMPKKGVAVTFLTQLFVEGKVWDKILWIVIGMLILVFIVRRCG